MSSLFPHRFSDAGRARWRVLMPSLATIGFVMALSPRAFAYRTLEDYPEVPDGARVGWSDGAFEFWTHDRGAEGIDAEAFAETSRRALWAWAAAPCAGIVPSHVGITPVGAEPDDDINTIEIVHEDWESLGFPADAAGATDVLFGELDDGSWAILEADIYLNAEHHRFTTASSPSNGERSLLGVITHEAGHALGLLHPCEEDGADEAPSCDPDEAPDDLMSPYYEPDQVYPEDEDYSGLCYLYPACERDEDCGEGLRCERSACVLIDADGDGQCDEAAGGQGNECAEKRATGDSCSESNQCEGGECVAGVEDVPVCTQRCGAGQPDCPPDWSCASVEDRRVCLPPNEVAGCTCRVPSGPGRSRHFVVSVLAMFGGVCFTLLYRVQSRRRRFTRGARDGDDLPSEATNDFKEARS